LIILNNSLNQQDIEIPIEDGPVTFMPGLLFGNHLEFIGNGNFRTRMVEKTGEIYLFQ
jgi:hypothetical protein